MINVLNKSLTSKFFINFRLLILKTKIKIDNMKKGEITFTMIKPTAVAGNHAGEILKLIQLANYKIIALKMTKMSFEQAGQFYKEHQNRPFYESLCGYMSSGPIIAVVLQKNNAVSDYREFIGKTNPEEAAEGSIRKRFGVSLQQNAVHGSDGDQRAIEESRFFFSDLEFFK